jgi:hypothetical protein
MTLVALAIELVDPKWKMNIIDVQAMAEERELKIHERGGNDREKYLATMVKLMDKMRSKMSNLRPVKTKSHVSAFDVTALLRGPMETMNKKLAVLRTFKAKALVESFLKEYGTVHVALVAIVKKLPPVCETAIAVATAMETLMKLHCKVEPIWVAVRASVGVSSDDEMMALDKTVFGYIDRVPAGDDRKRVCRDASFKLGGRMYVEKIFSDDTK